MLYFSLFCSDGLVAINKPYGVGLQKKGIPGNDESLFAVEDVLPELSQALSLKSLKPAKLTERFTSGISLLTSSDSAANEKIRKCYKINETLHMHTYTYWAVTLGEPIPSKHQGKVGLAWVTNKDIEGKLVSVASEICTISVQCCTVYTALFVSAQDP